LSEGPAADTAVGPNLRALAWGLVLFAGVRAIEIFLEAQSLAAAVGQAVLVEWGGSRLGIEWTAADAPKSTTAIVRRLTVGAAIGTGAALLLFGVLVASRGVVVAGVPHVEASVIAIGLATAALMAWRDELLFHGVVLRIFDGTDAGALPRVLACGVTSAGAALGRSDASARSVFVAAVLGLVFGALWLRDRGAWQPCAAHAAFRFSTGTLLSGGVVHSQVAEGAWAGGSAGMLGGTAAAIALAPLAAVAVVWSARKPAR
jgi:hypothetical protein